jgi:hypothetical protein
MEMAASLPMRPSRLVSEARVAAVQLHQCLCVQACRGRSLSRRASSRRKSRSISWTRNEVANIGKLDVTDDQNCLTGKRMDR